MSVLGRSHTASAFFFSSFCIFFFVKQKSVRCSRALKSGRQKRLLRRTSSLIMCQRVLAFVAEMSELK